ncbi:MAG: glycosyltransferase [Deltaproteobacteria bacterium]|nr:glycosyltransferase [Deltaproteobacteria bacterium]
MKQKVLFVNHALGGGIEKHMRELAACLQDEMAVLTLRPSGPEGVVLRVGTERQGEGLCFPFPGHYKALLKVCGLLRVSRVHFHHLMGFHPVIRKLAKDLGLPYDITLHDFHLIHSNPTMNDENGRFYQESVKGDESRDRSHSTPGVLMPREWREGQTDFLGAAERVFVPSEFAARLFLDHFPDLDLIIAWHPDWERNAPYPNPRRIRLEGNRPMKVASIGMLSKEKGADLFEACAKQAKRRHLPLEFHLIGYALRPLTRSIKVHGMYEDRELGGLISEMDPHVIWFPAQWPETYSYTLSAALESGRPLVVPNIGAFGERVEGRPLTRVEPWDQPVDQWLKVFLDLKKEMAGMEIGEEERPWEDQRESNQGFAYSSDYMAPAPEERDQGDDTFSEEMEWLHSYACWDERDGRETILRCLFRLSQVPVIAGLLNLIPYHRRRQIKRFFSRKPIHEIAR